MKKILLFAAILVAFVACKKDEPKQMQQVTFHVQGMTVETQPIANAPRKVAPLTDDDGAQMTDLILFDGATYLMRQQNTDPDFGTVIVVEF